MGFLPAPALRRILHLQNELVTRSSDSAGRALLSSTFTPASSGTMTPRRSKEATNRSQVVTSGSAATDLFLAVTGRNKLIAAGDRLRELIIPDALAQAVTAVGVGVVGGGNPKKTKSTKERDRDDGRVGAAKKELDELVASVCPLCEGSVVGLDKPFVTEGEDIGDWAV